MSRSQVKAVIPPLTCDAARTGGQAGPSRTKLGQAFSAHAARTLRRILARRRRPENIYEWELRRCRYTLRALLPWVVAQWGVLSLLIVVGLLLGRR